MQRTATKQKWERLLQENTRQFRNYFDRVDLNLGINKKDFEWSALFFCW